MTLQLIDLISTTVSNLKLIFDVDKVIYHNHLTRNFNSIDQIYLPLLQIYESSIKFIVLTKEERVREWP